MQQADLLDVNLMLHGMPLAARQHLCKHISECHLGELKSHADSAAQAKACGTDLLWEARCAELLASCCCTRKKYGLGPAPWAPPWLGGAAAAGRCAPARLSPHLVCPSLAELSASLLRPCPLLECPCGGCCCCC